MIIFKLNLPVTLILLCIEYKFVGQHIWRHEPDYETKFSLFKISSIVIK